MRLSSLDFKDTIIFSFFKKKLHLFFVPRVGFEPTTHRLEICCSIQLSYRGIYVFLIKYNKKIKNCFFFKELSCFSRFQRYYSFLRFPIFFLNFFIGYSKYNKTESIFNELLRFFLCFSRFQRYYSFLRFPIFFSTFFIFSRNVLFLRNFCLCDICNISDKYQHTDSNRD